jgi:hypothetical protein
MWRVVLDPRIPDGLADLRAHWTMPDLVHASEFLDQLDAHGPDGRDIVKVGTNGR